MNHLNAGSGDDTFAKFSERYAAENEARFPALAKIKTHPALDIIPLMTDDEMAGLVWSIRRVGLLQPIARDDEGAILDGRCRFAACDIAGVEPRFRQISGLDADGVEDFIWSTNMLRVHLGPGQTAIADAMIPDYPESLLKPEAKLIAESRPDLVERIMGGTLGLADAYQQVLDRERQEVERTVRAEAFARLRIAAPVLALQVDDGALTIDQALMQANEDAERLADHAEAIRALGKQMIAGTIEIGRRLIEAKVICGHGNWLPWLDREFGWKENTARNFMRVAELAKSAKFEDLNVPVSGLYLLAAPSTPDSVRDDVLRRAAAGEAFSVAEIKREITGEGVPAARLSRLAKIAEQLAEERPDDALIRQLREIVTKIAGR